MGLGRSPREKDINGKTCNIQQEYRLYLSTNEVIFKIPRKVNRCRIKSTFDDYPIIDIKKLDYQEESSCFLVDNNTHTYLTGDYVQLIILLKWVVYLLEICMYTKVRVILIFILLVIRLFLVVIKEYLVR